MVLKKSICRQSGSTHFAIIFLWFIDPMATKKNFQNRLKTCMENVVWVPNVATAQEGEYRKFLKTKDQLYFILLCLGTLLFETFYVMFSYVNIISVMWPSFERWPDFLEDSLWVQGETMIRTFERNLVVGIK